jgi:predicted GNAT family N-acyltransferase
MLIRKTTTSDIDLIIPIFEEARKTIAALGIDQWQNGYPSREVVEADVEKEQSYCVLTDDEICATMAILTDGEPTYDKIYEGKWLTGNKNRNYIAIHRVAVSVSCRGSGISGKMIDFAADMAKNLKRDSLRIDTHRGNVVMRKMLEKNGFCYCGVIYLEDGDERVAYEKTLI